MGLPHLEEVALPLRPELREAVQGSDPVVTDDQIGWIGRFSGECLERCDRRFACLIRLIHRRQIGDEQQRKE